VLKLVDFKLKADGFRPQFLCFLNQSLAGAGEGFDVRVLLADGESLDQPKERD
jgi:hypothetical protein